MRMAYRYIIRDLLLGMPVDENIIKVLDYNFGYYDDNLVQKRSKRKVTSYSSEGLRAVGEALLE